MTLKLDNLYTFFLQNALEVLTEYFTVVSRTIPEPNLPSGQAHKLGNNYYYTRDTRRVAGPPVEIQSSELIGPGGKRYDT